MSEKANIVAGIVTFHPEIERVAHLISTISSDVDRVLIYANSPLEAEDEDRFRAAARPASLSIMRPTGNQGLGTAYNSLLEQAHERGKEFLFILDQDSLPEGGGILRLADIFRELRALGKRPVVVAPQPTGVDGKPMKIPVIETLLLQGSVVSRSQFVISSGTLVCCETARSVGDFRADFFIDAIDIEWCMRANARGFSVWVADGVRMAHELGRGIITLPFGVLLTDQPPRRLYTFIRNQLVMLRLKHVPARHKIKTVLALPLRIAVYLARGKFSREIRVAIWGGIVDGMRHRLGPPGLRFQTSAGEASREAPEKVKP